MVRSTAHPLEFIYKFYSQIYRCHFIVSGMNLGENLCEDVFFSGTVAAAFSGYLYEVPALAVSLVGDKSQKEKNKKFNFKEGALLVDSILEKLLPLNNKNVVYNLNIPNPFSGKTEVTTLGLKRYKPSIVEILELKKLVKDLYIYCSSAARIVARVFRM